LLVDFLKIISVDINGLQNIEIIYNIIDKEDKEYFETEDVMQILSSLSEYMLSELEDDKELILLEKFEKDKKDNILNYLFEGRKIEKIHKKDFLENYLSNPGVELFRIKIFETYDYIKYKLVNKNTFTGDIINSIYRNNNDLIKRISSFDFGIIMRDSSKMGSSIGDNCKEIEKINEIITNIDKQYSKLPF